MQAARERRAYTCPRCERDGKPRRIFLSPGDPEPPRCPEHGRAMERQANVPYARSRSGG